mmetsp:Transcript_36435/g.100350  ORF Transcript_36435/g.100350 Transcript_36435/m.100350 type:complete len:133 (-) Transcript_36435:1293-1691(-)
MGGQAAAPRRSAQGGSDRLFCVPLRQGGVTTEGSERPTMVELAVAASTEKENDEHALLRHRYHLPVAATAEDVIANAIRRHPRGSAAGATPRHMWAMGRQGGETTRDRHVLRRRWPRGEAAMAKTKGRGLCF